MAPRKKVPVVAETPIASKAAATRKATPKKGFSAPTTTFAPAIPPSRVHSQLYHYPLLLGHKATCTALLKWFESVEETRSMPWRKSWIDPKSFVGREEELESVLATRAYEVWVSEVSKWTSTCLIRTCDCACFAGCRGAKNHVGALSRAFSSILPCGQMLSHIDTMFLPVATKNYFSNMLYSASANPSINSDSVLQQLDFKMANRAGSCRSKP